MCQSRHLDFSLMQKRRKRTCASRSTAARAQQPRRITTTTKNHNQESHRIQTRNLARQTANRQESQNQPGESDLGMFASVTAQKGRGRPPLPNSHQPRQGKQGRAGWFQQARTADHTPRRDKQRRAVPAGRARLGLQGRTRTWLHLPGVATTPHAPWSNARAGKRREKPTPGCCHSQGGRTEAARRVPRGD